MHNKYTISIGRLAVMLDSKQMKLVKRYNVWMPSKIVLRAYNKLIGEVNELLSGSEIKKEIEGGMIKLKLYNKAYNLFPALCRLTELSWDEKTLKRVKEITGYDLKELKDREILRAETVRLQDKYKELAKEEKKDGLSFAEVIISTEIVLEMSISRDIKLFEFAHYVKAAGEKVKQLEKKAA